ncbi:hypothetical protein SAMN04487766_10944 [Actinomyces ruminicola]|uniref:Uncharacterized protein n=1 Tax=Actinomyces ruminicola TaxID=332524 RepID=A0A1G9X9A6_9ACTO|nr:hypothetical protein SAMN04487766_10944 [Actinomyces ruminicola]
MLKLLPVVRIELIAHRSRMHAAALLLVVVACSAIASITIPTFQSDQEALAGQHVAYGYFYLPVIAAPVIASWLHDPFADLIPHGRPRNRRVTLIWLLTLTALLVTVSGCVGGLVGGREVAQLCIENALWVGGLIVLLLPYAGFERTTLTVVIYGTMGLFLPGNALLLINRDPSAAELLAACAVLAASIWLRRSRALHHQHALAS